MAAIKEVTEKKTDLSMSLGMAVMATLNGLGHKVDDNVLLAICTACHDIAEQVEKSKG